MTTSTYNFNFKNGTIKISKGIITKFDWFVTVKLNDGFIMLDQSIFLTKKQGLKTTMELLKNNNQQTKITNIAISKSQRLLMKLPAIFAKGIFFNFEPGTFEP